MDDIVGVSNAEERDSELQSSASVLANHEEPDDAELGDDQFLVESLLGKRTRRIRRRRVAQYLVRWKGYPEEENTWADEADIHEGLIKDYERKY